MQDYGQQHSSFLIAHLKYVGGDINTAKELTMVNKKNWLGMLVMWHTVSGMRIP